MGKKKKMQEKIKKDSIKLKGKLASAAKVKQAKEKAKKRAAAVKRLKKKEKADKKKKKTQEKKMKGLEKKKGKVKAAKEKLRKAKAKAKKKEMHLKSEREKDVKADAKWAVMSEKARKKYWVDRKKAMRKLAKIMKVHAKQEVHLRRATVVAKKRREVAEVHSKAEEKRLHNLVAAGASQRLQLELKRAKDAVIRTRVTLKKEALKYAHLGIHWKTPPILLAALSSALKAKKAAEQAIKGLNLKKNSPEAAQIHKHEMKAKSMYKQAQEKLNGIRKQRKEQKKEISKLKKFIRIGKKRAQKVEKQAIKASKKGKKEADKREKKAAKSAKKAEKAMAKAAKKMRKDIVPGKVIRMAKRRVKRLRRKLRHDKTRLRVARKKRSKDKKKVAKDKQKKKIAKKKLKGKKK